MARSRQSYAERIASYQRRHPEATRGEARGHGRRGLLSEYQQRVIATEVRRWVRIYNLKAGEAESPTRATAAHEREQVRLWILQFEKSGFSKYKEASAARGEYTNTARFFESFGQTPYPGETKREAAMDRFSEEMETTLGVTLDPRLDWFLGGPSPRDEAKRAEQRRRYREREARRRIERGAAGRSRRDRRRVA